MWVLGTLYILFYINNIKYKTSNIKTKFVQIQYSRYIKNKCPYLQAGTELFINIKSRKREKENKIPKYKTEAIGQVRDIDCPTTT